MHEGKQYEIVRRFFEDDDYHDIASQIVGNMDMEPAIEAFFRNCDDNGQSLDSIDITRLVYTDLQSSHALKGILFRALDTWARSGFKQECQTSAAMGTYIFRLSQEIGNPLFAETLADKSVLAQVKVIAEYLNQAFCDVERASLWTQGFFHLFHSNWHHPGLSTVFLLMMLRKPRTGTHALLDAEPLAMLTNCGYYYIMATGDDFDKPINHATFRAIIETALNHKFYLREEHDIFPAMLISYAIHSAPADFLTLIADGDNTLRMIIFYRFQQLFSDGLIQYQSGMTQEKLARLIQHIPKKYMEGNAHAWEKIQDEAKKCFAVD